MRHSRRYVPTIVRVAGHPPPVGHSSSVNYSPYRPIRAGDGPAGHEGDPQHRQGLGGAEVGASPARCRLDAAVDLGQRARQQRAL